MNTAVRKSFSKLEKKQSLSEKFSDPKFIIEAMSDYLKEGDVGSITDLISAYIKNSKIYNSQEEFATKIGTTRQTLHRMLSHNDNVSLQVFFSAIEQIHSDSLEV